MKIWKLFTTILLTACVASSCLLSDPLSDPIKYSEWETFKTVYNRTYKDIEEEADRLKKFLENKRIIDEHNKMYERGEVSYNMAINSFGDLSSDEFLTKLNSRTPINTFDPSAATFIEPYNVTVADEMDWRTKGAVTEVKNQGHCGSCWTFSATGALEGQHFRKTGTLVSLSEQNIIDCSGKACDGGTSIYAYRFIKAKGGIDTESSYPYEGRQRKCRYNPENRGATVTGYTQIRSGDENALKTATATTGPIAVAMHVTSKFQHYKSGVFYDRKCSSKPSKLNHEVLVVGYGTTTKKQDYWHVKNSWGRSWGDSGYVKMARNKNNNCGIATEGVFPTV